MSDASEQISCDVHGEAFTTYVCGHLAEDSVQRWHCGFPSEDNPWPDAWCDRCNEIFLREGEWNEKNEREVKLKLLCHHCYEKRKGESVGRLHGGQLAGWRSFVDECQRELQQKQDALSQCFSLGTHKRWDWDQERGEIVFSNDGIAALIAKVTFVGSVSTKSGTWLWSWANHHVLESARSRIYEVRKLGESRDFPHLLIPKWEANEVDGWEMAAVAAHVLSAAGVYRTPGDTGFTFMALSDVRRAQ